MRKLTIEEKMRRISGGLYLLLAVYQFFVTRIVSMGVTISQIPFAWLEGILLAMGATVVGIWLLSGTKALSADTRRGILFSTIIVIAYECITYSSQFEVIQYMLSYNFKIEPQNSIWHIVLFFVRFLLLVLAMFFAWSAHKKTDAVERAEEALNAVDEAVERAEEAVSEAVDEVVSEVIANVEAEAKEQALDAATELTDAEKRDQK